MTSAELEVVFSSDSPQARAQQSCGRGWEEQFRAVDTAYRAWAGFPGAQSKPFDTACLVWLAPTVSQRRVSMGESATVNATFSERLGFYQTLTSGQEITEY